MTRSQLLSFMDTAEQLVTEVGPLSNQTHYVIQRTSDHWFWMFDNIWTPSDQCARRFAFATTAQLTGESQCWGDPTTWQITPVQGA